ncbi:MAG: hypothetical protein ACYC7A_16650 [Thermoanaerobaculia bacterium]
MAAAMSLEALLANMKPYQSMLHELRGFKGAVTCASNHNAMMAAVESCEVLDAVESEIGPLASSWSAALATSRIT